MTALVKVLAAEVDPASIRLEHLVRSVRHNGAVVEVMAMREGEEVTFVVEQVLLALPPRLAARSIHFSPQLPPATLQAWTATPTWMAPHAKYLAVYPEPFWRELGLAGAAQSNAGPMVEIHDASSHDGPGALFGFIGVPAQSRASIGANELIAACRAQMVRLFGPGAQQPIADLVQDWAADPLTATALDQTAGGHALAPSATIADGKWIGRLVGTASEWSPEFPGYVAGAIDAADRAVDEIARFVGAPAEQAG
jgi:monoamine oxidase